MNLSIVLLIVFIAILLIVWLFRNASSKFASTPTASRYMNTPVVKSEMVGVRVCDICGTAWKSNVGMLKDSGFLGSGMIAGMGGTYSAENLAGLTCSRCGKSFCKQHMGQEIPNLLPGGHCPNCGGELDLA